MVASLRAAWGRGQRGWPARYPIAQAPNAPLLVFLAASVAHRLADGDGATAPDVLARAALAVWAVTELVAGVNAFRRGLGAVVLVAVVARVLGG